MLHFDPDGDRETIVVPALTEAGERYALARAEESILARVALHGLENGWPETHVVVARSRMNQEGPAVSDRGPLEFVCPSCGITFDPLPWATPEDDLCDSCSDAA